MTHREVSKPEGFELLPGVVVPQNETIFTAIYCQHRDEAVWPAAEEFLPERFMPVSGRASAVGAAARRAGARFGCCRARALPPLNGCQSSLEDCSSWHGHPPAGPLRA
jgi:hypothetical protein